MSNFIFLKEDSQHYDIYLNLDNIVQIVVLNKSYNKPKEQHYYDYNINNGSCLSNGAYSPYVVNPFTLGFPDDEPDKEFLKIIKIFYTKDDSTVWEYKNQKEFEITLNTLTEGMKLAKKDDDIIK